MQKKTQAPISSEVEGGNYQNPLNDYVSSKIRDFANIKANSFYGNSPQIESNVIKIAIRLNDECIKYAIPCEAIPGINGDIVYKAYFKPNILDFNVNADGSLDLVIVENGNDVDFQYGLTLRQSINTIQQYTKHIQCDISESWIGDIGTQRKKLLTPHHSTSVHRITGYRSYAYPVLKRLVGRSVNTSKSSTLKRESHNISSGSSTEMNSSGSALMPA